MADFYQERKEDFLNHVLSFLPNTLSEELKESLKKDLSQRLGGVINAGIDSFCEEKDICRICIKGGYDCDSDHK